MVVASGSRAHRSGITDSPTLDQQLVGREGEMDRLRAVWRRALRGRSQLVLLRGAGGVGKTRLAMELGREVAATGASLLVGTWPAGGVEPGHGLVEAMGPDTLRVGPGCRDRATMFESIAVALADRAHESPVLLVVDDLHRADRTSLLALRHVLEHPRPMALTIVGAYREATVDRTHPLAEFLAAVEGRPGTEGMSTGPLSTERLSIEALTLEAVTELVGDADLGRHLWRHSGGNPLLISEMRQLGMSTSPPDHGLDDVVARRMGRLSPMTRGVVEVAAVIGYRFSLPVLTSVTGLAGERASGSLREAVDVGMVVRDSAEPAVHRFTHELVRETIERSLGPGRRVRLHLAVGRALTEAGSAAAPPAAVAWHYRAGAPLSGSSKAVLHSTRAGDRAVELLAWEDAAIEYSHALAAARRMVGTERADLLLALGRAQHLAGETVRARQSFLDAADIAHRARDGQRLERASAALGQVAAAWGGDPALDRLTEEARAFLRPGSERS